MLREIQNERIDYYKIQETKEICLHPRKDVEAKCMICDKCDNYIIAPHPLLMNIMININTVVERGRVWTIKTVTTVTFITLVKMNWIDIWNSR